MAQRGPLTVLDVRGVTITLFSKFLHPDGFLHPNGGPVIDRTGVTGVFDIHLEGDTDAPRSPDSGVASDPGHGSAIDAMRMQLGLRFKPGQGDARTPCNRSCREAHGELSH